MHPTGPSRALLRMLLPSLFAILLVMRPGVVGNQHGDVHLLRLWHHFPDQLPVRRQHQAGHIARLCRGTDACRNG